MKSCHESTIAANLFEVLSLGTLFGKGGNGETKTIATNLFGL